MKKNSNKQLLWGILFFGCNGLWYHVPAHAQTTEKTQPTQNTPGTQTTRPVLTDTLFISLHEAWERTNVNSKELKVQSIKTEVSEEHILDAKRKMLPEFDVNGQYGTLSNVPVFMNGINHAPEYIPLSDHSIYYATVDGYLPVYHGGAIKTAIETAREKKALQEHILEETNEQLHLEVIQHYLTLQRYFTFKDLMEHTITQSKERLRQIQEFYDNGVVLKSDLLRARLQLSRQQTQLITIQNNIILATQSLNILMGNDDDVSLQPVDSLGLDTLSLKKGYAGYVTESMDHSPLAKMAEDEVALSKLNAQALKADRRPHIGLYGEYSYNYPQIKLYPYAEAPYLLGQAGIRLSYKLSSLYHETHKERAAELGVEQQQVAQENVADELRQQLKTAYKRFEEDLQKIQVARRNIEQSRENYRIVDQTYFNQLALLTDLLDADNQFLQAQFELVDNLIAAKLHYYQLLKISGAL